MDGICFSSFKGSVFAHDKIFAGNTLRPQGARKIFRKPPVGPILHERKARKYLCYCNWFIRSIPISSDGKKSGRRLWRKKRREKHRVVNMQLGCVHDRSATLPKQNTAKRGIWCNMILEGLTNNIS